MARLFKPVQENQIVFLITSPTNSSASMGEVFSFDVVKKASTNLSSTLTNHPIDSNANISDHSFTKNIELSYDIIMTDYPLKDPKESGFNGGQNFDFMLNNTKTFNRKGRTREAYHKLKRMQEEATLITAITGFDVLYNCIIKNITITEDGEQALKARVDVEQARIVTNELTTVPAHAQTSENAGTGKKKKLGFSFSGMLDIDKGDIRDIYGNLSGGT